MQEGLCLYSVLTIALLQLTMTAILQPAPEPDLNDLNLTNKFTTEMH